MTSMPASLAVREEKEGIGCDFRFSANKSLPVPERPLPRRRLLKNVLGIVGLVIVTFILSLNMYFVAKYLL